MADPLVILFAVVLIMCYGTHARSDVSNHRYKTGDPVPFYANNVGPYHNPSETYAYYDLPFCSPDYVKKKKETFGEVLSGYHLVDAPYKLDFLVEKDNEVWCRKKLTKEEVSQFRRAVARDYFIQMYAHDEELVDSQEETGWKNIHGDVFRYPHHKSLFAAAIGCGAQLFTLMIFILILGLLGVFYPYNRGLLLTTLVIIYAITSGISGYTAVSFYSQLEGTNWTRNLLLTGLLFCGPLLLMFCFLNAVAVAYGVTIALPLSRILVILIMYTVLASPLLLLGGILGKNTKFEFDAPCRTSECPRVIPPLCWYRGTLAQMTLAGILPFNVICRELHYVFRSIWGHRIYTIDSILVTVVIIVLIATAFMSVALTYFQLAAEDHKWWWRSFLCGGSTGLVIYGYCFYYYFSKSDMDGFMQISHFFGYMACICYGVFLMLGTVGFYASLLFVRYIYGSIKCD